MVRPRFNLSAIVGTLLSKPAHQRRVIDRDGWERRRAVRYSVACGATVVRNGRWTSEATLAEVSLCGLRLEGVALGVPEAAWTPNVMESAARVWLSMVCPTSALPLRLLGRVVWYEGQQAGVAFVSMTTESRVRLWQMVTALGREARGRA